MLGPAEDAAPLGHGQGMRLPPQAGTGPAVARRLLKRAGKWQHLIFPALFLQHTALGVA